METFPNDYILEVDVQNTTESMVIVTTEDFKIKQKEGEKFLSQDEVRSIFPPDTMTRDFIDIVRLRPKIGDTIPGEQISLTCEFTVKTAKVNGMYNVVSKCSYGNTIDIEKADEAWENRQIKLAEENLTKEEIEFQKRNFYLLDANRYFRPDSFDFLIQSIGVFDNKIIIKKACHILQDFFLTMYKNLESEVVPINTSLTTVENSFDIILMDADYTVGKVLEYILYDKFFEGAAILSYCGFKKIHPHDTDSIIRLAYKEPTEKHLVKQHLRDACTAAAEVFLKINDMF
jgi:DNA-directed RNA polymerase subunit L